MSKSKTANRLLLVSLLLAAVSAVVYAPLAHSGLLSYDDPEYVTWNIAIQHGLTLEGLKWAFTTGYAGNWHPLTWVSYMLDYQCFGGTPGAMHLTNVVLHIANSLLVLWLLHSLTGAVWRSAFVAGLFALHPLHVESVAWVAERKDVLSVLFGLLALWAYARYAARSEGQGASIQHGLRAAARRSNPPPSPNPQPAHPTHSALRISHSAGWYGLSLLLFACSLMSKPMLVTLPCVLLLLDYWPLKRLELRSKNAEGRSQKRPTTSAEPPHFILHHSSFIILLEKLPFFALTAADAMVTFLTQKAGGAIVSADALSAGRRLANALMAYVHYLHDAFWPVQLGICYPQAPPWPLWQPLLAGLLLAALTAWLVWRARRAYLVTGWFWFLGTLVPVIGLVQTGAQTIADRFMYFPLLGLAICLAWGAWDLLHKSNASKLVLSLAALLVLGLCAGLSTRQVSFWEGDLAAFSRALAVNPDNFVAHHLYAVGLQKQERYQEAFEHLNEALRLNPRCGGAHVNLAAHLGLRGDFQGALAHARTALELQPADADAHDTMAVALLKLDQPREAERHFREAIRCRASFAEARNHLACLLMQEGKWDEAIAQLREALRYQPDSAEFQQNLNYALAHGAQSATSPNGS